MIFVATVRLTDIWLQKVQMFLLLEKAKTEKAVDDEELERLDKIFRFQVAQKLTKQAKR